ncbi:hypothetical protein [Photobacterium damselae]|uniref:hypothetical protein n=1 Tax=Photobacterium damselae TaxID=38293 RepID=UPI00406952EB
MIEGKHNLPKTGFGYEKKVIVYDDTCDRFVNAINHVKNNLEENNYDTTKMSFKATNQNILSEDDRICIIISSKTEIEINNFLGWTDEAIAAHKQKFHYKNICLETMIEMDKSRFYSVCDGDKLSVLNHRVQRRKVDIKQWKK